MPEVAEIFREYGSVYKNGHKLPLRMIKAMNAIENCRTSFLGGHIDMCDACGHVRISYNSCRNRHCPKCQSLAREKWLKNQKKNLLPIKYFHTVFTIPDCLNPLTLRNQKEIYSILFKASSETLLELGEDSKYIGARIGFISILHTWGQNLMDHPHLHCIVTGGGLSKDSTRWTSSREKFFIPVKVLSKVFRGKFLAYLKESYEKKRLKFDGAIKHLETKTEFKKLIDKLYTTEWVVYCKPPFKNAEYVLEYLGRYTHRIAISNSRILNIKDGKVTFKWKDYRDNKKEKIMTVDVHEFIRRFLLHILPDRFVKIRYYGFLSNRCRKGKLRNLRKLLGAALKEEKDETWKEMFFRITGIDLSICPCCRKSRMVRKQELAPKCYIPPGRKEVIA